MGMASTFSIGIIAVRGLWEEIRCRCYDVQNDWSSCGGVIRRVSEAVQIILDQ